MHSCLKCGAVVAPVAEKTRSLPRGFWRIGKVLFWLGLCLVLFLALWPVIVPEFPPHSNTIPVAVRGKDIYVAITDANKDREPIGLPPLWPKTCFASTNHPGDVSSKIFTTSSVYFYELYDGPNVGNEKHDPYIKGFDYSKLAGAGVPAKSGGGKLDAQNNMWIIAANITDQDDDRIPFLITRNVDVKEIERVVNKGLKASEFKIGIDLGKGQYKAPFSNKGFAAVFKGGAVWNLKKRTVTLGDIFKNKELPPRDPSKPPIVYLLP
jgi:hypothetical protein